MDLTHAIAFDIETLPNVYTLAMETLQGEQTSVWEISDRRDDRAQMFQWFKYLHANQIPMVGFNSINFDYPVIHYIYTNPQCTVADIYDKAMSIIKGNDRFGHMIWERDRFAPQVDLFLVHHMNNPAKRTSLKALQINMRSPTVVDSPVVFGTNLTSEQIDRDLIPYNQHDVSETKRFAHMSMSALQFRVGLIPQFGVDVMNYNDTKIGAKILEQRLGDDVCYTRASGRKQPRQTPRRSIALRDVIFPYISFRNAEFNRVLEYMRAQTLTPDDIDDPDATIKTKGVFAGLSANVGGIDFHFGTGGVHASVTAQRIYATEEWLIEDIDVAALYPTAAIKNQLSPAHLGQAFVTEYAKLPAERNLYKKGTVENASYKLASNGTYGNSNNKYSVFYDPAFTMTVTINCQLLLSMLVEWLIVVPTLKLVQVNTDGVTYIIHRNYKPQAVAIQQQWEAFTLLTLESVQYSKVFIADVNNYIAVTTDGKLKQKGKYWHPDPTNYAKSLAESSPAAFHKDLGNIVSIRAAVAAMVRGIDPEHFIRLHSDPFDFMGRARATGEAQLLLGGVPIQKTTRYYVARDGAPMTIVRPPAGPEGAYKRKNGVSEPEWRKAMEAGGWQWNAAVCTGKASDPSTWGKYEYRTNAIEAGWRVAECNDAANFRFDNVNYDYYIAEARKLIIA